MASTSRNVLIWIARIILFIPVFAFLVCLGFVKTVVLGPLIHIIITLGDYVILLCLWPVHFFWSIYCLIRTKKFGPYMKCLLIVLVPVEVVLWTVIGLVATALFGFLYSSVYPYIDTFKAVSKSERPLGIRLIRIFTDGTWSNIWAACIVVRDFAEFSFYSYFSVMDDLLNASGEEPIELRVAVLPGCLVSAILGILVDVVMITVITIYKSPVLLIKGWFRLIHDFHGSEGPFLETRCVPFAGLLILLWPVAVVVGVLLGVLSSLGFGCYAAAVAYQENSTKRGLLYVIASISIYDEYTNDLLYLPEGSCYPRPKYRDQVEPGDESLVARVLHQLPEEHGSLEGYGSLTRRLSDRESLLQVKVIWDSFFKSYEDIGVELLRSRAIGLLDLENWKHSNNKIVNIGIPAYAFLECFFRSIKTGSPGFVLRDEVEITSVNRPEGRIFGWLYEPMCVIKEQIRHLNLTEEEELYFFKHCLFAGDVQKIEAWQNGGSPPSDEIRRAQLEGISRRLQGLCVTLSRLPTSRRRFLEVVKHIEEEAANLHYC